MIRTMHVLATAACLAAACGAQAAPARPDVYQSCLDNSGGVDPVMKQCGADEIGRQEKVLNAAYGRVRARLTPPLSTDLVTAQRAWLTFRDAQCRFEYDRKQPGTMGGLLYQSCVLDRTALRIRDLRAMLKAISDPP